MHSSERFNWKLAHTEALVVAAICLVVVALIVL